MIHVENLTKYFNQVCAVDQVSFDIRKGEIVGLLGPNGAGKTTTLRMLTGFLDPSSGSIRIEDYNIGRDTLEIKKLLGYLPESAPLYHEMIVFDYLNYVADIRALDSKLKLDRVHYLADICGLNEVMHKPINQLSKGYKQRVGLAHALMNDPEILVLDEPTSGLDPNQIVEIREIIKQIGKEKTIILSTHILSEAEATCNRIVIINKGKIVADSETLALKQSADQECLVNMSLKHTDLKAVTEKFDSLEGVMNIVPSGTNDEVLCLKLTCMYSNDLLENIYKKIKETDWILLEFHQEAKTLEYIFRELTMEN